VELRARHDLFCCTCGWQMPLGKKCRIGLELRFRIEQVSLVSGPTESGRVVEWGSQDGEVGQAGGIHLSILAEEAIPLSLCMNEWSFGCRSARTQRNDSSARQGWLRGGGWASIVSAGRAVR
jgi:hypothetical protein